MKLDPKQEFIEHDLPNIIENCLHRHPQDLHTLHEVWMLDMLVKQLTAAALDDNTLPKYKEKLAAIKKLQPIMQTPAYREMARYCDAWLSVAEAALAEIDHLTRADTEWDEHEWKRFTEQCEWETWRASLNVFDNMGIPATAMAQRLDILGMRSRAAMIQALGDWLDTFMEHFPQTPDAALTIEWTSALQQLTQYKQLSTEWDPQIKRLLEQQDPNQPLFNDDLLFNSWLDAVQLLYNDDPRLQQTGRNTMQQTAAKYPWPYAALATLISDDINTTISNVLDFINTLVIDEQDRQTAIANITSSNIPSEIAQECCRTIRHLCTHYPETTVALLPSVVAWYLNSSSNSSIMSIVPSMRTVEDEQNPIIIDKLLLAKQFTQHNYSEEFIFAPNTSVDKVEQFVTSLINGLSELPEKTKQQMINEALEWTISPDKKISQSEALLTWIQTQPEPIAELLIKALPRYSFARMLYIMAEHGNLDTTCLLSGTDKKVQEFVQFVHDKLVETDRNGNHKFTFWEINGFINQMCINGDMYEILNGVLSHYNGWAKIYQNPNGRDDRNGLDYRVVLTYKINDKQYACTMQVDSKGMRNTSAGSNISQAIGIWLNNNEHVLETALIQASQKLPEAIEQSQHPTIDMLFDNNEQAINIHVYNVVTSFITQCTTFAQSLTFNSAKDYKYAMRSLWGNQLYDICMDKASEVLNTNRDNVAQKLANQYFLAASSELANIIKSILPTEIGILTPQYLRNQIGNTVTVQGAILQTDNNKQRYYNYNNNNKKYYQKYKNNERDLM